LWIADDPATSADGHSQSATLSLSPAAAPSFTGLQLQLRM
jgi:hypothetical protein